MSDDDEFKNTFFEEENHFTSGNSKGRDQYLVQENCHIQSSFLNFKTSTQPICNFSSHEYEEQGFQGQSPTSMSSHIGYYEQSETEYDWKYPGETFDATAEPLSNFQSRSSTDCTEQVNQNFNVNNDHKLSSEQSNYHGNQSENQKHCLRRLVFTLYVDVPEHLDVYPEVSWKVIPRHGSKHFPSSHYTKFKARSSKNNTISSKTEILEKDFGKTSKTFLKNLWSSPVESENEKESTSQLPMNVQQFPEVKIESSVVDKLNPYSQGYDKHSFADNACIPNGQITEIPQLSQNGHKETKVMSKIGQSSSDDDDVQFTNSLTDNSRSFISHSSGQNTLFFQGSDVGGNFAQNSESQSPSFNNCAFSERRTTQYFEEEANQPWSVPTSDQNLQSNNSMLNDSQWWDYGYHGSKDYDEPIVHNTTASENTSISLPPSLQNHTEKKTRQVKQESSKNIMRANYEDTNRRNRKLNDNIGGESNGIDDGSDDDDDEEEEEENDDVDDDDDIDNGDSDGSSDEADDHDQLCQQPHYSSRAAKLTGNGDSSLQALIESLADYEGFEVHEVAADGNCMFAAVLDQLHISGQLNHSVKTLRKAAVSYLRENPIQEDGTHLESFLQRETWEEYLSCMSRNTVWGDHMILKALAEFLGCRIVVMTTNPESQTKTVIEPRYFDISQGLHTLYLGHIGECHFNSLRPQSWEEDWPAKAKIFKEKIKLLHWIESTCAIVIKSKFAETQEKLLAGETGNGSGELFLETEAASTKKEVGDISESNQKQDKMAEQPQNDTIQRQDEMVEKSGNDTIQRQDKMVEKSGNDTIQRQDKMVEKSGNDTIQRQDKIEGQSGNDTCERQEQSQSDTCYRRDEVLKKLYDLILQICERNEFEDEYENLKLIKEDDNLSRHNTLYNDTSEIDSVSGVALPHLSFLFHNILKSQDIICRHIYQSEKIPYKLRNFVERIGSTEDGLDFYLVDHHATLDGGSRQIKEMRVLLSFGRSRVHTSVSNQQNDKEDLFSVTQNVHPGYLCLKPVNKENWKRYINEEVDKNYITHQTLSTSSDVSLGQSSRMIIFIKFYCPEWPESTSEWVCRDRPSGWPDPLLMEQMMNYGCYVVSRPHPQSTKPDIEWMYMFTRAEKTLISEALSSEMKYSFSIFKVLVDYQTKGIQPRLSTNLLKTVLFYACEVVPSSCWNDNVGGCVLYLLQQLLWCLKERNIPNYFIRENNMIDHFPEDSILKLIKKIEILRVFPVMSLKFLAEHYSLTSKLWMMKKVVLDMEKFRNDRNLMSAVNRCFVKVATKQCKKYAQLEQYYKAYGSLKQVYQEEILSIYRNPPSFQEFLESVFSQEKDENFLFWLGFEAEISLGKTLLPNLLRSVDTMLIGQVADGVSPGKYDTIPVPKSLLSQGQFGEISFLNKFATQLAYYKEYEDSAHYTVCIISKVKEALLNTIDISEVTDQEIRRQVTNKTRSLNRLLFNNMYSLLYHFYCEGNMEKIQEYRSDFEDCCNKVDTTDAYRKLSAVWDWLESEENPTSSPQHRSYSQASTYSSNCSLTNPQMWSSKGDNSTSSNSIENQSLLKGDNSLASSWKKDGLELLSQVLSQFPESNIPDDVE